MVGRKYSAMLRRSQPHSCFIIASCLRGKTKLDKYDPVRHDSLYGGV